MPLVHSPLITTRNLVLNYDFANIKSYPGTGTSIFSNWNVGLTAGTLVNTPTFSTSHNGIMTFDGVNEYAKFDIGSSNLTEPMTVEIWVKPKSDESKILFSWGDAYTVWFYYETLGFNTANSDSWGFDVPDVGVLNKWQHFVFEMRSNVSTTNNKIYWNGVEQTLDWVVGFGDNATFRTFDNGRGSISCRASNDNNTFDLFQPTDIACFRIYRGALTQAEVSQNYNAHRGRFGL